ncbi:unnamed protein product [Heterosigma akashiwo]
MSPGASQQPSIVRSQLQLNYYTTRLHIWVGLFILGQAGAVVFNMNTLIPAVVAHLAMFASSFGLNQWGICDCDFLLQPEPRFHFWKTLYSSIISRLCRTSSPRHRIAPVA